MWFSGDVALGVCVFWGRMARSFCGLGRRDDREGIARLRAMAAGFWQRAEVELLVGADGVSARGGEVPDLGVSRSAVGEGGERLLGEAVEELRGRVGGRTAHWSWREGFLPPREGGALSTRGTPRGSGRPVVWMDVGGVAVFDGQGGATDKGATGLGSGGRVNWRPGSVGRGPVGADQGGRWGTLSGPYGRDGTARSGSVIGVARGARAAGAAAARTI